METNKAKFERTREKFRRNIQREEKNKRRTIFLEDDEVPNFCKNPSSSRRPTRQTDPGQTSSKTKPEKARGARNFRMTVVTPTRPYNMQPHQTKTKNSTSPSEQGQQEVDNTFIDEDEMPPPPPIWKDETGSEQSQEIPGEDNTMDHIPSPSMWADESLLYDDLEISSEDLNDPFILEFCRSFWGTSDTAVDRRSSPAPSPSPSSSSSLDWESENFRPPTPPRRRGFASFEVHDQQYPYLGMTCYERVWRAQIMIPRATTMLSVANHIHQRRETSFPWRSGSSPPRFCHLPPSNPVTPGRGWLNSPVYVHQEIQPDHQPQEPHAIKPHISSPIPPTPPIFTHNQPPVHPLPSTAMLTIPDCPRLDQLPEHVRAEISKVCKSRQGTRLRFRQEIWGHSYRITIERSGKVLIART